ncbi:TspO/MBR family protein [Clostridium magnum]|uniref:TspO/MBR family protein n=1 Tax=Clostridium magnum DSM 2767 TaxID=1121326 RepID=A0A162R7C8_9CLOT|nr:TspO/MBR family protein [Clostridium magnum DSM 2767]SHH71743.1 TspO and MBR related proteins [Clostridium magnum DSM 2767]
MINLFKVGDKKKLGALFLIIILTEALGFLSGYLAMSNRGLYDNLIKPSFSPPGWVFPIVWSILYLFMAIAFYRIWLNGKGGKDIRRAMKYYFIQLGLNLMWTVIFFRFKLYGLAFIELLLMLIFILLTTFKFYKIDKTAGILMIPYIIWVSFAGVLNYTIWMLNEM